MPPFRHLDSSDRVLQIRLHRSDCEVVGSIKLRPFQAGLEGGQSGF